MSSNEYTVKLSTSDGQTKEVSWNVFRQFRLFAPQDDPETRPREAVPLPNVSSGALDKVIEYCEYHQNDSQENESTSSGNPRRGPSKLSEWDQQFMQVEQEMIFEIILAANYLDIKPLLDISCKTMANMIKNKTPEEIRKLFNIVNEFTPEEQAQIKEENQWAPGR